jgi:hypothetical protein
VSTRACAATVCLVFVLHLDVSVYKNAAPGGAWSTKDFFGLFPNNKVFLNEEETGAGGKWEGLTCKYILHLCLYY